MTTKAVKPATSGDRARNETALHKQAKSQIADALALGRQVDDIVIERRLDGVRPDVSFCIGDHLVAVEVQCSPISTPEIRRRTDIYTGLGYYVLWLAPLATLPVPGSNGGVAMAPWQRHVRWVYGGLPVWMLGQTITVAAPISRSEKWTAPCLITDLEAVVTGVWLFPWDTHRWYRSSMISPLSRTYGEEAHAECERLAAMGINRPAPIRLWSMPPPPRPTFAAPTRRQDDSYRS